MATEVKENDTPYEKHKKLGHKMGRYSPNGITIIEECEDCGARFLHNPCDKYPVTMRHLVIENKET